MATAVKDSHSLRCENCGDRESVTPGIRLCLPCWRILLRVEILGGETAQTLRVECRHSLEMARQRELRMKVGLRHDLRKD